MCVEVNIGDIYSTKIILVVHPFPLCFYLGSSFFGGANWVCFFLFVHGLTVVFAWSVLCCYVSFFLVLLCILRCMHSYCVDVCVVCTFRLFCGPTKSFPPHKMIACCSLFWPHIPINCCPFPPKFSSFLGLHVVNIPP